MKIRVRIPAFILFIILPLGWGLSGCKSDGASNRVCNPLGGAAEEDCFLPFPSSFYTRPDPSSATGVRVDLSKAALPVSRWGTPLNSAEFNRRDGFSNVATLLAYFPERIDPSSLPDYWHAERSLDLGSPVQLMRYDTGERVPLFAELDANAGSTRTKQVLIIQPIERLRPKTQYVAVIQGLRTREGTPVAPLSGFRRLRDGNVSRNASGDAEKIFHFLSLHGFDRRQLQLAWDFTTGSDESVLGRLVRMRDETRKFEEEHESASSSPLSVDRVEARPRGMNDILLRIVGSFRVPSFLEGGNGERLWFGPDREPAITGYAQFPLVIQVPACALRAKHPLPVMIYGHGTFNTAEREMTNPYVRDIGNRLCMIQIGTDWLGRARGDLPDFIFNVLRDWNNFNHITDRLQQAHINLLALTRMIKSGALDRLPGLRLNGRLLLDPARIYYYGISEGGCQGVTALALNADLKRGAFNVPCGFWSMFFWRSSDFYYPRRLLALSYPEPMERQELTVLSQLLWDHTDPANFGPHLLSDPLPGNGPKKVLYQEGINDASVPNLTTRAMVRDIGLKLLRPHVEPVMGVEEVSGPSDSAYSQFDVGSMPRLGGNNIPPAQTGVHEEIRRLEAAKEQLRRFLREGGQVEDVCGGRPCIFPSGSRFAKRFPS